MEKLINGDDLDTNIRIDVAEKLPSKIE